MATDHAQKGIGMIIFRWFVIIDLILLGSLLVTWGIIDHEMSEPFVIEISIGLFCFVAAYILSRRTDKRRMNDKGKKNPSWVSNRCNDPGPWMHVQSGGQKMGWNPNDHP